MWKPVQTGWQGCMYPGESKTVWVEEIRSEKEVNQKTLSEEIVLTSNYDVAK